MNGPYLMSMTKRLTPTQRRLLNVLKDGKPHAPKELFACLPDDLGDVANVRAHLTKLRVKLRDNGQDIVCERLRGRTFYRHVRADVYQGD